MRKHVLPNDLPLRRLVAIAAIAMACLSVLGLSACTRTIEANPDAYVGVGVELTMVAAGARVVRVLPKSPAEHAGLNVDDVLVSVGDRSARGLGLAEVVDLLRGQKGTEVQVKVKTKSGQKDVVLKRAALKDYQ